MKKLSKYLNVIPVLAKGDCYTQEEVLMLKQELCREAAQMKLEWFDCEAVKYLFEYDNSLTIKFFIKKKGS
jgi:septin family protein